MCIRDRVRLPSVGPAHRTQLQQWLIWWEAELGLRAPHLDAALRQACRAQLAAGDELAGHTVSALQREVGRALERLRVPYVSELVTSEGYSVDLAMPERRVALEVDGPHHFAHDGTPTGATRLKQRQLRATGWRPVNVSHTEWYALRRQPEREAALLEHKLAAADDPRWWTRPPSADDAVPPHAR